AEAAVADDADVLFRVQCARLPLHYVELEQAKTRATGDGGLFLKGPDGWRPRPDLLARLDHFVDLANQQGVTRVHEWHTSPTEYGDRYRHILERVPTDNLATGRPVEYVTAYSPKYPAAGDATLVDGLMGPMDHSYNWLGWEGVDMEVVVDLEQVRPVAQVSVDFLQSVGSWIFLPTRVEFSVSEDGRSYRAVGAADRQADERQGGIFAETFAAEIEGVEARYVKVKAVSLKTCPEWHIGGGGPCWIFADEVVVR
ncbi:discoidin domain-containing protein, partial [Candidatus Latescibacterota bacterium]